MKFFKILGMALLALTVSVIAAPIRVGIYRGVGTSRYWHTSIHPGADAIAAMLANPAGARLQNPVIPLQGFSVTMYGVDTSCHINGCAPTIAQNTAFINALDTIDVLVFPHVTDMGSAITSSSQRQSLANFWVRKGVVNLHNSTDDPGSWAQWSLLNGARFQNHPSSERLATLHLDSLSQNINNPSYSFLNRGLPDTVRFSEEWFSFTTNGNIIRTVPYLKALVNIDENSYEGGLGGARAMGADHPMSWYREFPEGGRFFYTALAHRTSTFDSVYFFRRQLYNAILWAGKYNVTPIGGNKPPRRFSDYSRLILSGSVLTVSLLREGDQTVEILGYDGRRMALRVARGQASHTFTNLPPNAVYIVVVTTAEGRRTKLVAVQ